MSIAALSFLLVVGTWVLLVEQRRTSLDVCSDLWIDLNEREVWSIEKLCAEDGQAGNSLRRASQNRVVQQPLYKSLPYFAAAMLIFMRILAGPVSTSGILATATIGAAASYIGLCFLKRRRSLRRKRLINFFLPLVMERLVMAVESGFDIIAAILLISKLEDGDGYSRATPEDKDPVSPLLVAVSEMTEAGAGFAESLNKVAENVDSSALRHAFIHLALAYKEGGELIMPLRELSDSTQLFYQESAEEEIAAMPVKATIPLLLTFAGLVCCFVAPPLVQVISITSQALE